MYAENPLRGFLPSTGRTRALHPRHLAPWRPSCGWTPGSTRAARGLHVLRSDDRQAGHSRGDTRDRLRSAGCATRSTAYYIRGVDTQHRASCPRWSATQGSLTGALTTELHRRGVPGRLRGRRCPARRIRRGVRGRRHAAVQQALSGARQQPSPVRCRATCRTVLRRLWVVVIDGDDGPSVRGAPAGPDGRARTSSSMASDLRWCAATGGSASPCSDGSASVDGEPKCFQTRASGGHGLPALIHDGGV